MDLGMAALLDWKVSLWKYHVSPAEGRKAGRQQMLLNTLASLCHLGIRLAYSPGTHGNSAASLKPPFSRSHRFCVPVLSSGPQTEQSPQSEPSHQRSSQYRILITFFTQGFIYWIVYLGDCTLFQTPFLLRLCVLRNAVESLNRHEKRTVGLV